MTHRSQWLACYIIISCWYACRLHKSEAFWKEFKKIVPTTRLEHETVTSPLCFSSHLDLGFTPADIAARGGAAKRLPCRSEYCSCWRLAMCVGGCGWGVAERGAAWRGGELCVRDMAELALH